MDTGAARPDAGGWGGCRISSPDRTLAQNERNCYQADQSRGDSFTGIGYGRSYSRTMPMGSRLNEREPPATVVVLLRVTQ